MQSRWHRALRSGVATPAHEVLRVVESRSVWMARLGLGLLLSTAACGIPSRRDMMPRRSDVLLKSVEIHPGWRSGCDNECNSTLDTAAAFSATRIDWTFLDPSSAETAAFLRAGAAAGVVERWTPSFQQAGAGCRCGCFLCSYSLRNVLMPASTARGMMSSSFQLMNSSSAYVTNAGPLT